MAQSSGPRQVYVLDSGLQTAAPLAFQDGLISEAPATVVDFLRASDELPDLTGISVTWIGLGDTAAPQATLTNAAYEQLKAIWSAILHASGAAQVTIDEAPLPLAPSLRRLPAVTPVAVPALSNPASTPLVVELSATSVDFVPNESQYLDPSRHSGSSARWQRRLSRAATRASP